MAIVLSVLIVATVALLVCKGVVYLAGMAVVASKAVFSLVVALVLHGNVRLVENGWANYGIWAAICLIACYVLCLMPRFNCAFQFFCTSLVSYIAVEILVALGGNIIMAFQHKEYDPNLWVEIVIKAVTAIASAVALVEQIEKSGEGFLNPILENVERGVASVLYAVSVTILVMVSMNDLWVLPNLVGWAVFLVTLVGSFLLDMLVFENLRGRGGYHAPVYSGAWESESEPKGPFGMDQDSYDEMMKDAWSDDDRKDEDGFGNRLPDWQIEDER